VFFTSCETLNNNSDAEDEFLNDSGQTFSADKKENVQNKKEVSGKKQLTEQERKAMKEADMWLPDDTK
jgi:predicted DNA binding protein